MFTKAIQRLWLHCNRQRQLSFLQQLYTLASLLEPSETRDEQPGIQCSPPCLHLRSARSPHLAVQEGHHDHEAREVDEPGRERLDASRRLATFCAFLWLLFFFLSFRLSFFLCFFVIRASLLQLPCNAPPLNASLLSFFYYRPRPPPCGARQGSLV